LGFRVKRSNVIDAIAAACAIAFVAILGLAAYWDPSIRVLHTFEAIPYLMAAGLCLRQRKVGYLLGVAGAIFWLWMAGTLTTFVHNGFERLAVLLRTGQVDRPDVLIAAPAAIFAAGLAGFSLWGYSRLRNRSWRDLGLFVVTLAGVAAFFIAIFAVFTPRYLGMFRRLVG
jgi:hypothetical protein